MLARRQLADHLIAVAHQPRDRADRQPRRAPGPYAAILALPMPAPVGPIAHKTRNLQAAALRRLFERLGVDSIRVHCPRGDSSVIVGHDPHPYHVRHRFCVCYVDRCHACQSEIAVRDHLRSIVLAAYPDMEGPASRPSFFAEHGGKDRRFYVFASWRGVMDREHSSGS